MTFKDENETHRVTGFFSRLYGSVFKGNGNNIEKGILTGIQYVLIDEDSGFNNADKHNITTLKYTPYYGLDQIEVDNLFNHFDISNDKKEVIKSFYNGYHIKDINSTFTPKYNIYSLIKYLDAQDQGLEGYWQETKSFDFIKNLFNKKEILSDILDLINQKSIVFDLNTKFSKNDFKKLVKIINESDHSKITQAGKDTLYSYLLITGYLTNSPDDGGYHIPNTEIIKPFAQELKTYFKTIYKIPQKNFTDSTKNLGEIFTKIENDVYNYKEAVDAFSNSFQEIILSLFQDKQNLPHANEDLFHSLVNIVALNTVGKTMGTEIYTKKVIDGQYTSKKGRADIILANENTGMIIEMKYDGDVEKALEQAQEYENLIKDKTTKLFIGLNVTKDKKVEVKHLLNFNVAKKQ
jgi:hypothetical protein